MKGKVAKKFLAVASAVVLVVSGVVGDYCTAYAATVTPTIDVEGGLSYLLQMLSSGLGVQVSKASVPALWLAVDAQAKANDPEYMAELRSYCEDNSLISTRELDPSFCNQLLKDLRSIFGSAEREEGSNDFVASFSGSAVGISATGTYMGGLFSVKALSEPIYAYIFQHPKVGNWDVCYSVIFISSGAFKFSTKDAVLSNGFYILNNGTVTGSQATYDRWCKQDYAVFGGFVPRDFAVDSIFGDGFELGGKPVFVSVSADRVWVDAYDDAALHVPVITAPVSVPADVADIDENLKSVSLAEDKDALYKALAAAGIAIDIGIDVPDETDKPTDAEIPDDGSVSVGKSLSDILAAITGLADKVAAIPSDIAAFFTPDMTAVSESFDSLKDSLMLKFGGLLQLADVFNRSYKFDTVIPVIKIPIPDNETLRTIFDQKTELVILDLTPFASDFQNFRSLLTAMLYVAFAFWFLDEFDVKIHIG